MAFAVRRGKDSRFELLISKLERHFEPTSNGLSHKTDVGNAIRDSIADCIVRPADIASLELTRIVALASLRFLRGNDRTTSDFLSAMDEEAQVLREQPTKRFTIIGRINYLPPQSCRITFRGSRLTISNSLPQTIDGAYGFPEYIEHRPPDPAGGIIRTTGEFRSVNVAGFLLSARLEDFCGFANFLNNQGGGFVWPENARAYLKLGPNFYLYDHEKEKCESEFWINTSFDYGKWETSEVHKRFEFARSQIQSLNKRRKHNPLIEDVYSSASLLNESWLEPINDRALTNVWNCFELMFLDAADGSLGSAERIAKRASKFDSDDKLRRALIASFGEHRNYVVHPRHRSGADVRGVELYREHSRFIIWIMRWAIQNGARFQSKSDFLDWLDIPKDRSLISRRRKLLDLALSHWFS